VNAAIRAAQAVALGPLTPPDHVSLRDGDMAYWNCIVTARARDTWTQIDLTTAANLARTQADVERLQKQLDAEGYMLGDKANPLVIVVNTLSRRALSLARALHVHAEATVGAVKDASIDTAQISLNFL
jgi:hypothetical protein